MTPPPPVEEQRLIRLKDRTLTPSAPYLLLSNLLDVTCTLPVIRSSVFCPTSQGGGWRSLLSNNDIASEWVDFPHGKLSHSYESSIYKYTNRDVSYSDYIQTVNAQTTTTTIHNNNNNIRKGGTHHPTTITTKLQNHYNYAFQTNSTELGMLTNPMALCVLSALVLLVRLLKKMCLPHFSNWGQHLGQSTHGPQWTTDNHERIIKFGEYVYRLFYHSSVSIYGVWYFYNKSWWNKGGTRHLWEGHPNHPVEPGMAWYYLVQSAYNVDALISLLELSFRVEWVNPLVYSSAVEFLELEKKRGSNNSDDDTQQVVVVDECMRKREVLKLMKTGSDGGDQVLLWTPLFQIKWSSTVRGDFREMMAHHFVTNCLIFLSSYYRFTRIGSMIFLVHDLSDVPIDMSKLANFVKWKTTTIVCFVTMVLLWIVTRLIIFPFVICGSVLKENYQYLVVEGILDPALHEAYYAFFYLLLASLVLLHVTWFLILLRIGWTLVSKGETHDYSEHKNGEKQKSS